MQAPILAFILNSVTLRLQDTFMKLHNFNSGPSILPLPVLEQASNAIHNFNDTGLSILEIGHRTSHFQEVLQHAIASVKRLMQLDDQYEVLFLHGGATTQFMQVPMNLLDDNQTAAYCDNGIWGSKAIKEASIFGNVVVAASSADRNYSYIPKDLKLPENANYLHITSNNTVEGTQWHQFPETNIPLIADMSSDIFSRQIDFKKFSLIYAGAQKNMGAAGVNMLVIKKDILGKIQRRIPTIMNYQKHIEAGSLMNTPPVFAVYVSMLTLKWIEEKGGLLEMEKGSKERSKLLYNTIDSLPLYNSPISTEDRSDMNAIFFIKNESVQNQFLEECKQAGFIGVKGYRTVGGIRVSMYNALPMSSVTAMTDLMRSFAAKHS